MSQERLTNAAARSLEDALDYCNTMESPDFRTWGPESFLAEDFTYVDRRTGGVNFGALSSAGSLAMLASAWDVGSGRPHFSVGEVVAVRGEESALVIFVIVYDDGNRTDMLHVQHLDRDMRWRRIVQFDLDDVEAAIAELDQLNAK